MRQRTESEENNLYAVSVEKKISANKARNGCDAL